MRLRHGNMWRVFDDADLFVVTTNSVIKTSGELVMGKGIARQARDRFPHLAKRFGDEVRRMGDEPYGLITLLPFSGTDIDKMAAFQVKRHFMNMADIHLIEMSAAHLSEWGERHPGAVIHMNFPGIGNGGLGVEDVLPVIHRMPDNVFVWTFKKI